MLQPSAGHALRGWVQPLLVRTTAYVGWTLVLPPPFSPRN